MIVSPDKNSKELGDGWEEKGLKELDEKWIVLSHHSLNLAHDTQHNSNTLASTMFFF